MEQGQVRAISGLAGAAIGGIGGAMIAGEKGKRAIYALGGIVLGGIAGTVVSTLAQQAAPAKPPATTGTGAVPQLNGASHVFAKKPFAYQLLR